MTQNSQTNLKNGTTFDLRTRNKQISRIWKETLQHAVEFVRILALIIIDLKNRLKRRAMLGWGRQDSRA